MKLLLRPDSATIHILLGLIPYTEENILLAFKPNVFFNELEKSSGYSFTTLKNTYRRARKNLIAIDGEKVSLSLKARQTIYPYIAQKLPDQGKLMVIFDIPERLSRRRCKFRYLLRTLKYEQIQKSVWMSSNDSREIIIDSIKELRLGKYVQIYESARLDI